MLSLLLACTPAALLTPTMNTAAFLDPTVTDEIPERAWIDGPGAVTIGGQRLVITEGSSTAWPVYAIEEDHLGLVVDTADVRFLATVERAALRPVLPTATLATPDPRSGTASGQIGFIFPAGTPVDPDLSFHGSIPIPAVSDWIEGTGWVAASEVDAYAELDDARSCRREDFTLRAGTPLLDAPGGEAFAWLTADSGVAAVGVPEDGWLLVELARPLLTARGYVPAPDHDFFSVGGFVGGGSCYSIQCWGYGFRSSPTVRAGSRLLDAPGGAPVGLVLVDLDIPILDRESGYSLVEIETGWGLVALWVE
ncbi:MAG: hypothetical protein P8R54_22530 [Myxococcota bacterium]|nr:hypothetical protein [Myxococcota bacterium]